MLHPRSLRLPLVALLSAVLLALVGCEEKPAASGEPADPPPADGPTPDIIFVLIDTLRADSLGSYGNADAGTPALDAIAAEGTVFNRAIAQAPWTQPSIASLFCSRYPGVHKVLDYRQAFRATFEDAEKVVVFDESFPTIAESLQQRGYQTAGFVANPFILKDYGFAQGFDHFDSSFAKNTTPGGVVNEVAMRWLASRDPDKPVYLYLHYMDPHGPYDADSEFLDPLLDKVEADPNKHKLTQPEFQLLNYLRNLPEPYRDEPARHQKLYPYLEYWQARYQAGVRQMDHFIGELREQLTELGLWQNAYVIITSDHGEALCEHGLWEHGWSAYHTDLHVPLIVRWPEQISAGRRVRSTVRLIDLLPTITDQLSLPAPQGVQGTTLVPHLSGRPPSRQLVAFAEGVKLGPEQKAIYVNDYKLIWTPSTNRTQLFNIALDPLEQNDLIRQPNTPAATMFQMLQQQVALNAELSEGFQPDAEELTEEQAERLRGLGYIQ